MLSSEGYIIGQKLIDKSVNKRYNFLFFFRGHLPLPRKENLIEKYYPFPRYKIRPTNGSEYTKFHFISHYLLAP